MRSGLQRLRAAAERRIRAVWERVVAAHGIPAEIATSTPSGATTSGMNDFSPQPPTAAIATRA